MMTLCVCVCLHRFATWLKSADVSDHVTSDESSDNLFENELSPNFSSSDESFAKNVNLQSTFMVK